MTKMVLVWLETASFLSWVVKDFSWVLLIPETAWVGLVCALIFESWDIQNHWKVADRYDLAGRVVLLLWILGNGTWMTSELLHENPSKNITFPWFQGALLGPRTYVDRELKVLAGSFWALGLLLGLAAQMLGRRQGERALRSRLNADLWVIFWVLKDFFWLLALPWNALACSVVIFYCLIDLRPSSEPKVLTAALISWLCGNTVWLVGELFLADASVLPRVLTCVCLACSFCLGIKNFFEEQDDPEARSILPKSMGTVNHGKL